MWNCLHMTLVAHQFFDILRRLLLFWLPVHEIALELRLDNVSQSVLEENSNSSYLPL